MSNKPRAFPSPILDPDVPPLSSSFDTLLLASGLSVELTPGVIAALLFVFVLLLVASAVFSGSEVALFSLEGSDREALAAAPDTASQRVLALLEYPRRLLVTILLLNTVTNVTAAILAALITAQVAASFSLNPTLTVFLEVIALTFVLLVVSEITPKLIATQHAIAFSRRVSGLILLLHRLLYPISSMLARSMLTTQRWFKPSVGQRISQEDLKAMAEIGELHGTLEMQERELINSIVEFGETTVREIMVSRLDVVALPETVTLEEALDVIRTSGHSRLPLYSEHLDHIIGVVYAKDLLPYLSQNGDALHPQTHGNGAATELDWVSIVRPAMFVPDGRKLDDLLRDFQLRKTHMAVVVDEYGGTAGLVTLEDVLEEIVGDIRDEHDEPEAKRFRQINEDTFRFDARIDLDEVNDLLGLEMDTQSFDFETLGGLVFHLTGSIPEVGDEVVYDPIRMRIESLDNHRIGTILVRLERSYDTDAAPEKDASGSES